MKLNRIQHAFVLTACLLIVGFGILNQSGDVPMKPWFGENTGPNVIPVSTVGLIQSDKSRAIDITENEIKTMVRQAIEAAGGLEGIVTDGQTVMLKPNIVSDGGKQPLVNGVTTDYRLVNAVAELVKEINKTGKVIVAEGSYKITQEMYNKMRYTPKYLPAVDEILTFDDVCEYQEYDSDGLVSVTLDERLRLYPDSKKPNKSPEIYLPKIYKEADVLISIPTLKNHQTAKVTGAIKNVGIGATPPRIYGSAYGTHNNPNLRSVVISHDEPDLQKWIHDFYLCRAVDFVITDGLQGQQNGPGGKVDRDNKNMRLILAGRDPVAVDAIHSLIIGADPRKVGHIMYLHNNKAGCADPNLIRIKGNRDVDDVKKKFAHSTDEAKSAMYSDFTAPAIAIQSAAIDGDKVNLSLNAASETAMVEVYVSGERLDEVVISDFGNISISANGRDVNTGDDITVIAYDKYLNGNSATATVTSVQGAPYPLVDGYALSRNYPNPFNPSTSIRYQLPANIRARLQVFDTQGRLIATLADGVQQPGTYTVRFDGSQLASGLYYYKLTAGSYAETQRMMLIK